MITVQPEGGLCNRMRVVASAWLLARQAERPMRVLWYCTPDFNARFDSLFDTQGLPFAVVEGVAWHSLDRLFWRLRETWRRWCGHAVADPHDTDSERLDVAVLLSQWRRRPAFVRTNTRLAFEPGMFRPFEPVAALAAQVTAMRPRLERSVGVHVRRTDNTKASAESTLDSFVVVMRAELDRDSSLEFFVASDESAVLDALRLEFGPRIWEHPKRSLARDDPAALADAVVDLYALAACRKVIGSYWSSFSETAAELSGIELRVARAAATSTPSPAADVPAERQTVNLRSVNDNAS